MGSGTVQPSTADNYLLNKYPTTNSGTETGMQVASYSSSRNRRAIFTMDFSSLSIPAGSTINVATLSLYASYSSAGRTIEVYRVLRADWSEAQSTWNIYKTGNNWTTAGCGSDGNDYTSVDMVSFAGASGWNNCSVVAQVQTALDSIGSISHFLLKDSSENSATEKIQEYRTKEFSTASVRPKLYIEWTPPVTFTPRGIFI